MAISVLIQLDTPFFCPINSYMQLVCSYCRIEMGEIPPLSDQSISHGMCEDCRDHFMKQWSGMRLGEYLDQFDSPILAISSDNRIIAANQIMADRLGKSNRELQGLLGGDAMDCEFSRLPGGCGKTRHCSTCTIRNTINETFSSQRPMKQVPSVLFGSQKISRVYISTAFKDGYVELCIEEEAYDQPYELEIEKENRILQFTLRGLRSSDTIPLITGEVLTACATSQITRIIVDARLLEGHLTLSETFRIFKQQFGLVISRNLILSCAIVDLLENRETCLVCESIGADMNLNVRIWECPKAALNWIQGLDV